MMKKITAIIVLLATVGFGTQTSAETVSSLRGATAIRSGIIGTRRETI